MRSTDQLVDVLEGVEKIFGTANKQTVTMRAQDDPADFQVAGLNFEKFFATRAFESELSCSHALVL